MKSFALSLLALILLASFTGEVRAQDERGLPEPLSLVGVLSYAAQHRQEIAASRAREIAASMRPGVVSALDDPMVVFSVDHLPVALHGADMSLMVEQRFPLSGERRHRRAMAQWDWQRSRAQTQQVVLEVVSEAAMSFLMTWEMEQMARILADQVPVANQLVMAATARYGAGMGSQAEVLRAEVELARLEAMLASTEAEIGAARAMLNASLGRSPQAALPPLAHSLHEEWLTAQTLPSSETLTEFVVTRRPELRLAEAEMGRARAEVKLMESMYVPMAMIGAGPAYTMAEGYGAMLMFGLSIPLWRGSLGAGADEARAMVVMAEADRRAMGLMAEAEAVVARERVRAAQIRLLALREEVLPRGRQATQAALSGYGAGQLSFAMVLEATQTVYALEGDELAAELALSLAWVRLWQAMGTLPGQEER